MIDPASEANPGSDEGTSEPLWKMVVPWIGAAAIIGYLFWKVPFFEVWAAVSVAQINWFLGILCVAVVYWFLLDSLAYAYLITRFNGPLSWKEARSMRGVTYLLAALNWNVGTAAIILYLRRLKQIPPLESASTVLFYTMFDALILVFFAFLGAFFFAENAVVVKVQQGAALILAANLIGLFILMSKFPNWAWLQKVRAWSVLRTYQQARMKDFMVLAAIRVSYLTGFVGCFVLGAYSFGIEIPIGLGLASIPVIMVAGALPISPAGLGTQAAAMLFFWSGYGEEPAIVAFGLVLPVALTLIRVLLGLPYLSQFRRIQSS